MILLKSKRKKKESGLDSISNELSENFFFFRQMSGRKYTITIQFGQDSTIYRDFMDTQEGTKSRDIQCSML